MRKCRHLAASYVPAAGVLALFVTTPRLAGFTIGNAIVQAAVFTALAVIPAHRTAKMSYVDIAWPWGLVAIGRLTPVESRHYGSAAVALTVAYLAIGLRMALPGAVYLARSRRLPREFARYRYRRMCWAADGWRGERVPMQLEIGLQALANMSVLATPALLVASAHDQRLRPPQLAALGVWLGAWSLEWLADRQKRHFAARAARGATCDVGLWRYSRHPNYFFQWLGWVALALVVGPLLTDVAQTASAAHIALLSVALAAGPVFMLWTLLELTGVKPAEHFSVQKRPGYSEYQRTTNRFVPGPPLRGHRPEEAHA